VRTCTVSREPRVMSGGRVNACQVYSRDDIAWLIAAPIQICIARCRIELTIDDGGIDYG